MLAPIESASVPAEPPSGTQRVTSARYNATWRAGMQASWQTVRVFISSTFRDMHAERDWLVKRVFPALRERLEPRLIHLVDVDLRWGITREQADNDQVLGLCLSQIEECRPFFLGLLGSRYGWVPLKLSAEIGSRYGWTQHLTGKSITELEILHGVINDAGMRRRALFCFRSEDFLNDIDEPELRRIYTEEPGAEELMELGPFQAEKCAAGRRSQLSRLKEQIRALPHTPVLDGYPCTWDRTGIDPVSKQSGRIAGLSEFANWIIEKLEAAIVGAEELRAHFAALGSATRDEAAEENGFHDRFIENRTRVYFGRKKLQDEIEAFVAHTANDTCLVTGPSGSGKSAALAKFVSDRRLQHPGEFLIAHFVGAGPRSTRLTEMLARLCRELKPVVGTEDEVPQDLTKLTETFQVFLGRVPAGRRVVLVIDALNQLDETDNAQSLYWLPAHIPAQVRLILSCIDDPDRAGQPALVAARSHHPREIRVDPLEDEERLAILREVPSVAAKTLDESQIKLLMSNEATRNPLFLLVALEELRGFGSFEQLTQRIGQLPRDGDTLTAIFLQVIQRLSEDFDRATVREVLTLLGCARRGLSERELLDLVERPGIPVEESAGDLFPILRQLRPYLQPRGSILDFFHRHLAKAVREAWNLNDANRIGIHDRLACYFNGQSPFVGGSPPIPNSRRLFELPYQLGNAGRSGDLCDLLVGSMEWMKAQHAANGNSVAFSEDLALALEVTTDPLALISLHAARETAPVQSRQYNEDDLRVLVGLGRKWEAANSVRSRVDPEKQCRGWIALYEATRGRNADVSLVELAVEAATRIRTDYPRGTVLKDIVDALARDGLIDRAREIAAMIRYPWARSAALKSIATAMAAKGDSRAAATLAEAVVAAKDAREPSDRSRLLVEIALEFICAGDARAEGILEDALSAADEEDVGWKWSWAYAEVTKGWARLRRTDRVLEIAGHIRNREPFDEAFRCLTRLAKLLAAEKLPEAAFHFRERAMAVSANAWFRCTELAEIALSLSEAGDYRASRVFSEALADAYRVESPQRAAAIKSVAVQMSKAGDNRARETMQCALSAIENSGEGLYNFAETYAQIGEFDEAINCAERIPEFWSFNIAVDRITTALFESSRLDRSVELIDRLARTRPAEQTREYAAKFSSYYARIAENLADRDNVPAAVQLLPRVNAPLQRAQVFGRIAKALARQHDPSSPSMFTEALRSLDEAGPANANLAYSMREMAKVLLEAGDSRASDLFDRSFATADQERETKDSVEARKNVAIALASTGRFAHALALVGQIPDSRPQAEVLKEVAVSLAAAGQFDRAISVASSIKDGRSGDATVSNSDLKVDALRAIAGSLKSAKQTGEALRVLDLALSATARIASHLSWFQADALLDISAQLARCGRAEDALHAIQRIPHEVRIPKALASAAVEINRSHSGSGESIARRAVELADRLPDPDRIEALCDVAVVMSKAGRAEVSQLLEKAYAASTAREDQRAYRLGQVGRAMAESGKCERALEIARLRETGWQQPFVVKAVYKALRLAGDQSAGEVFHELHERLLQIDTYMAARDEAIKSVIEDLLGFGDNDAAVELLGEMSTDNYSSITADAACMIARSIALSGDFRRALALLEFKESRLPEFIGNISTWAQALEHIENGLSFKVLLAICRIGGWVSPAWYATYKVLTGAVVETHAAAASASRGLSSVAHQKADPDRAARLNLEYQKAKRAWESLPAWKRLFTRRPKPPTGI
jgi:tetratricopeptide (TPR) repeat protein